MAHTDPNPHTETYSTRLLAWGNNTAVVVPDEVLDRFGKGKRPGVIVSLNGYEYCSTVAVMDGMNLIPVRKEVREGAGLTASDEVDVSLTLEVWPRQVDLADDFAAALDAQPKAREFYDALTNSLQRFHADNVNAARTPETRQRRIDKSIALFLDGKKR